MATPEFFLWGASRGQNAILRGKNPTICPNWLILAIFSSDGVQVGGRASPMPPLMLPLHKSAVNLHRLQQSTYVNCSFKHPTLHVSKVASIKDPEVAFKWKSYPKLNHLLHQTLHYSASTLQQPVIFYDKNSQLHFFLRHLMLSCKLDEMLKCDCQYFAIQKPWLSCCRCQET